MDVINNTSLLVKVASQVRSEVICRRVAAGQLPDDIAFEVGEGLSDHYGYDYNRDQEQQIHNPIYEEG